MWATFVGSPVQLCLCEEYRLLETLVVFEVVAALRNTAAGGNVSTESILAHGNESGCVYIRTGISCMC